MHTEWRKEMKINANDNVDCAAHALDGNKKTVKTIISIFNESLGMAVHVQRTSRFVALLFHVLR